MNTVRLRHVATLNPSCPRFARLPGSREVSFLPMEAVWPGDRLDLSRTRSKDEVASGYTRFQVGDVLVPKITPTFEADRSVLIEGLHNGVGAGTTELHVLRAGPQLEPRFLLYLLRTRPFLKFGEADMYGVAGQKRVPDEFLANYIVDLPPLEKQRRIADFLDAELTYISRVEKLHQEVAERLSERESASLDIEVLKLTERYAAVPFRRLIARVEQGVSPQCHNQPASLDTWGVLKVSSVKRGTFQPEENKELPQEMSPERRYEVKKGDLLVTRANTPELVGDAALVPAVRPRLLLCDKIFRVSLTSELDAAFVAYVAQGSRIRSECSGASHGTSQSMANIKATDVKRWPIPAAPFREQQALVDRVSEMRTHHLALQQAIDRELALLAERRQALITAAVTGQLDVTTARSGRSEQWRSREFV